MSCLVTICARGGSKGVPGKNIKPLMGRPLIAYSIKIAEYFLNSVSGDLVLSTDSSEIKAVAADYGLLTDYVRPDHLSNDTAGKVEAIADVLKYTESNTGKKYDYLLDLDISSPLRTLTDLNKAFEQLKKNENALNLFSVNSAHKNPYFNMVEQLGNGFVSLSKSIGETVLSRQAAPQVYEMNASFYFYRKEFFNKGLRSVITEASLPYVMDHICFDIDSQDDYLIMQCLLENGIIELEY